MNRRFLIFLLLFAAVLCLNLAVSRVEAEQNKNSAPDIYDLVDSYSQRGQRDSR